MIELQPSIDYYYLTLIFLDIILVIIMLGYMLKIYATSKAKKGLKVVTTPLLYFASALTFSNFSHILAHLNGVITTTINADTMYMLAYAGYSFAWMLGLGYYLKNTLRLKRKVKQRFNFGINFILIISILSFIAVMLMLFVPNLVVDVQRALFLSSFATLGLSISVLFYRFIVAFRVEKERNPSKIVKARIDLLFRVLWIQIILGISYFALSTLVIIYPMYESPLNLIFFLFTDTITALAVVFLYWSVEIPDHIRVQHGISPTRFSYIKHQ